MGWRGAGLSEGRGDQRKDQFSCRLRAGVQRSLAGQNPMELGSWGSYSVNDVSAILPNFFTYTGNDYTRDPQIRKLVEAGGATVDPDQRRKAYTEAIKLITAEGILDAGLHLHGDLRLLEAAQLQAISGRAAAVLPRQLEVVGQLEVAALCVA